MNNTIEKNLNDNGVLRLSLNRPDTLNAMNADLIMGLLKVLMRLRLIRKFDQ